MSSTLFEPSAAARALPRREVTETRQFDLPMTGPAAPLYFGTRRRLASNTQLVPSGEFVYASPTLDGAIWAAELDPGEDLPRVFRVEATGELEDAAASEDWSAPPHPSMTLRTRAPLRIVDEVTEWRHYHGTKAELAPGDHIEPGRAANFGPKARVANYVYFTRTLDASIWGAELAMGEGPGRIYIVEPTGPIEDDPNLTNARFRGNPTKSFRSRSPLRVVGEVEAWIGHPPEVVRAMKAGLARLDRDGVEPED